MQDLEGKNIGRYHIVERLGQGGMAVVYKAFDLRLDRDVAIKFIRVEEFSPSSLEQVLKRFEKEGKALARFSHNNIVQIYDFGEYQGVPYLVMEYLPGGTLKRHTGKPIAWQDAASMIIRIARALDYSHKRGVIHRDIKPSNIMFNDESEPKLADFGIARILEGDTGTTITAKGAGVGTPEYMAPEQGLGKAIDGRADVYALGVVLYELITGIKPYTADTPVAVIVKQINDPLPRPSNFVPDLPEEIEKILFKTLAKDPQNRFADMTIFADELEKELSLLNFKSKYHWAIFESRSKQPKKGNIPRRNNDLNDKHTYDKVSPENKNSFNDPDATKDFVTDSGKTGKPKRINLKKFWKWAWVSAGGGLIIILGLVLILISQGKINIPVFANNHSTNDPKTETSQITTGTKPPSSTPGENSLDENQLIPTETGLMAFEIGSMKLSDKDGMILVYVPGGEFEMGSENSPDEEPVHKVYLNAFWIDRSEITNAMFTVFLNNEGNQEENGVSWFDAKSEYVHIHLEDENWIFDEEFANYPVSDVSWFGANAYCEWANRRLPTEAEWEKAARGTDGRLYPWGNTSPNSSLAKFSSGLTGVGAITTGSFSPAGDSPYGAQDMSGNVWEWVQDWYDADYYLNSEYENPQGPSNGVLLKVIRGGAWNTSNALLSSANRESNYLDAMTNFIGFRCVKDENLQ